MPRLLLALGVLALAAGMTLPAAAQPASETPVATEPAPAGQETAPPPVQPLDAEPAAPAEAPQKTEAAPEPAHLTPEQFHEQLVGVPLCGVPPTGPLAGKILCTVHLPDGIAVVAGSGVLVRGLWEIDEGRVCRRSKDDPLERRRCVTYERVAEGRYRNSDGVEVCLGPCGQ